VDQCILRNINFSGDVLRMLAGAAAGAVEGMRIARSLNYLVIDGIMCVVPNPCPDELFVRTIDIEDIEEIIDGCIVLDQRPEKKKIEIISEKGDIYALGYISETCYIYDLENIQLGIHAFDLCLTKKITCPKSKMMSSEIHINGYKEVTVGKLHKVTLHIAYGCI